MLSGSGIQTLLQAVYFVLIARALGPSQYGAFIGAVALIGILVPFAGLGFGGILIKHTARDRNRFAECWGNALLMTLVFGIALLLLVLISARLIVGNRLPAMLLLLVGSADLLCFPVVALAGQAFVAFEKLRGTAGTLVVLGALRTLGAILIWTKLISPDATSWATVYLISSGFAAIWAFVAVTKRLAFPKLAFANVRPDLLEGFYFALGASSQTIYNDIDKTMLVRFSMLSAAGIYGTAYRIVDVTFQPISALLYASFARFFKAGENGLAGSIKVARRLLPLSTAYGAGVAVALFLFSPVLPTLLGRSFADAIEALRWLSVLSLFRSIHYLAANALTGAGLQGVRAWIQIAVAAINVGLNLWLIPNYSWRGAAWASLACDGMLAIAFWTSCSLLLRKVHDHSGAFASIAAQHHSLSRDRSPQ